MATGYEVKGKVLKVNLTEVTIYRETPYTFLTRSLPGNQLEKNDEELIQSVLEIVNIEFDPSSTLAKLTTLSNEIKELAEHTKRNSETAQKSLLELTEQVFNLSTDVEALKGGRDEEGDEEHHEEAHSETSSTGNTSTPTDGTIASN